MALIEIKVIPHARRNEIAGWEGKRLKIRVTAAPEKGKANAAVIALLAEALGVAKREIEIVSGETSRIKRVKVPDGLGELWDEC